MSVSPAEAKGAARAQAELRKARYELMARPDDNDAKLAVEAAEIKFLEAAQESAVVNERDVKKELEATKYVVSEILDRKFDMAARILALLLGITTEELLSTYSIFELVDVALAVWNDEEVRRFFTLLGKSGQTMPSGILPK